MEWQRTIEISITSANKDAVDNAMTAIVVRVDAIVREAEGVRLRRSSHSCDILDDDGKVVPPNVVLDAVFAAKQDGLF